MAVSSTKSPSTCVLFVLESIKLDILEPSLVYAQHRAMKAGVPFAVIYFSDGPPIEAMDELLNIEQNLLNFNIPFIVLIGDREKRIEGLKSHLNPLEILSNGPPITLNQFAKLQPHPYPWPGKVMTIEELSK